MEDVGFRGFFFQPEDGIRDGRVTGFQTCALPISGFVMNPPQMSEIHCHTCGGFITHPAGISYRLPSETVALAPPHSGLCTCCPSIVYGPPPGYLSLTGLPSVDLRRMAARN